MPHSTFSLETAKSSNFCVPVKIGPNPPPVKPLLKVAIIPNTSVFAHETQPRQPGVFPFQVGSGIGRGKGGQAGDGQNALAVSDLSAAMTMSNGTVTFDTFYNTLVARVGLDASEATSFMEAEEILAVDIESQRLSVSGVSLDEEMSYLLSYQHAYEAMVQVANTIDEMLDTLIVALG